LRCRISNSDGATLVSQREGNPGEGVEVVAGSHSQNGSLEPHSVAVYPSTRDYAAAVLTNDPTQVVGIADGLSSWIEGDHQGHPCLHAGAGCATKQLKSVSASGGDEAIGGIITEGVLRHFEIWDDDVIVSQHEAAAVHDGQSV